MGLCQDLAAAYWPPSAQDTAQAVCEAESHDDPNAHCLNCAGVPEDSRGLWQINVNAHPQWAGLNLYDPATNAQIAAQLSQNGTLWTDWSTYTSGTYRQYLLGAPITLAQLSPTGASAPAPANVPSLGAPSNLIPLAAGAYGMLLALSALRGGR